MQRGPKPKPTALRLLEGNLGKRPINDREPQPTLGAPAMPEFLDPLARQEWELLVPELEGLGLLARIDGAALAAFCTARSRWQRAEQHIQQHGEIVTTPNGHQQPSAWLAIANRALEQMRRFGAEFGLSPSARSTLKVSATAPEFDELEQFKRTGIAARHRVRDRYAN